MVLFLLNYGCAVNTRDKQERTALHLAAYMGHEDVVWTLLQRSADVNARDKNVSWAISKKKFLVCLFPHPFFLNDVFLAEVYTTACCSS